MEYIKLSLSVFSKLANGNIEIWCNYCKGSTWHFKQSKKRDRRGFSGVMEIYYTCEVCKNISPLFDSGNDKNIAMREFRKENKRVTCPKCNARFWYSYKLKASKCKKCGFKLPLNAVIEI